MPAMTTAEMLAEARGAYHRLLTGTAEVDVTYKDRRVRFNDANKDKLGQYILALEAVITPTASTPRSPIRAVFG